MATWEEMLSANYSPIQSLRDLSARRRADERRAAGLNIPAQNNQFRQFDAPTLLNDSAAWIESQQDVAEQLWGTAPEAEEEIIPEDGAFTSAIDTTHPGASDGPSTPSGLFGGDFTDQNFREPTDFSLVGDLIGLGPIGRKIGDSLTDASKTSTDKYNQELQDQWDYSFDDLGYIQGDPSSLEGVGLPDGFATGASTGDPPGKGGDNGSGNGDAEGSGANDGPDSPGPF